MSFYEKYILWKKGLYSGSSYNKYTLKLIRSGISEEQAYIISQKDKYETLMYMAGLLLYFLIGLLAGGLLSVTK